MSLTAQEMFVEWMNDAFGEYPGFEVKSEIHGRGLTSKSFHRDLIRSTQLKGNFPER